MGRGNMEKDVPQLDGFASWKAEKDGGNMKNNEESTGFKQIAAAALRVATRTYVRHAPWRAGKDVAFDLFNRHVNWRGHRTVARTRWGDLMHLSLPDAVQSTIYMTGCWEPVITQYIRSELKSGDIFVDCGANVGYYSLLASRLV